MYDADELVGSVMASFDGHRGMVYFICQRRASKGRFREGINGAC